MSISPVSKLSDCGDGYGVATVSVDGGTPQQARIDLNRDDNTPRPRIIMEDGSVHGVDDSFISAYNGLTLPAGAVSADIQKMCERTRDEGGAGWLTYVGYGGAFALSGLSYRIDSTVLSSLDGVPGLRDSPQRGRAFFNRTVLDVGSTVSYQWLERNLRRDVAFYVGVPLAAVGGGLAVWGAGSSDDVLRYAGMRTFVDAGVPVLRRAVRGEAGFDWIHLGTGLALFAGGFLCPAPGTVSEREMYAPEPSDVAGHYNVRGNPYEGGNTGATLCRDAQMIGLSQAVSASRSLLWRVLGWDR